MDTGKKTARVIMTEIYLVRHGQASMGQDNYDVLSELGELQALWLAQYLDAHSIQFDQYYSGTLQRQIKTLEPIHCLLGADADMRQLSAFDEFDFIQIIRLYLQQHPELHSDNPSSKYWFRLLKQSMQAWSSDLLPQQPGNERWADFVSRVKGGITQCCDNGSKRILISTSGGVIACAVGIALGLDPQHIVRLNLQIHNASISRLFCGREGWSLHSFNALPHMSGTSRADKITYV